MNLITVLESLGPVAGRDFSAIRGNASSFTIDWIGDALVSDVDFAAALSAYVPPPERDWAGLATRMNANIDWLRLVKSNGAAAELARYVSLQDVENARAYWIFLDSEGDLPESLKEDIAAAAIACNLSDLFAQISGDPV